MDSSQRESKFIESKNNLNTVTPLEPDIDVEMDLDQMNEILGLNS